MENRIMFTKAKIGSLTIKNRLVVPPMGISSNPDGSMSDRAIRYYEERAKGGFGLIITGYSAESQVYESTNCNVLESSKQVAPVHDLVQRLHAYGAKVCMQLGPGLGRISGITHKRLPYSASEIPYFWNPKITCQALTVEQIHDIVNKIGVSAALAKKGGADAVELRVYGGYLGDQFMSSLWNKRTDEYGGSLENRMRFTLELIESIQKTCGKDYPLIVKYNPYHAYPGGRELEEGIEIAKMLEKAGVAALHIDKGCYEVWYHAITTVYQPEAHQIHVAEEIKKHVNIPVIAQGKLDNPVVAEKVLAEGKTDFVALGHQSIADPLWPNKVKTGKLREITPCIGCNECVRYLFAGYHITCSVNPQSYHEDEYPLYPAVEPKKVLVVGGGPGGIEAALIAAQRGHKVSLWEKTDKLGGLLVAAGAPYFKKPVQKYVDYIIRKLDASSVDVRVLKEATAKDILKGNFDHVIIATGSDSIVPPIKGVDSENVYISTDVLVGNEVLSCDNVVVLGGGLVGCETAAFLAEQGKKVTIVEMLKDILAVADHNLNNDQSLRAIIKEKNINVISNAKVTEITETAIKYAKDNVEMELSCDALVLACGYKSNNTLAEELEGEVECTIIGDSVAPRKILTAVHEGFHAARIL